MARPGRPERNGTARSFRQLRRFHHGINSDKVFGMHNREDAVYWLPAWRDEYETTTDPQTEVSLIYHHTRLGLEERIARIESRKSITALPLPRTSHQISNVELRAVSLAHIETEASFAV